MSLGQDDENAQEIQVSGHGWQRKFTSAAAHWEWSFSSKNSPTIQPSRNLLGLDLVEVYLQIQGLEVLRHHFPSCSSQNIVSLK
jgi:hypothetical protein